MIKVITQFQSAPTVIPPTHWVIYYDTTDPAKRKQIKTYSNWQDAKDWVDWMTLGRFAE
jgi:hypothetical protein